MTPPTHVAHYQLLELIGRDGPIETWRARDSRLQRTVAVQILRRLPDTTQEAVDRFRRQAHVASLVTHPTSVPSTTGERRTAIPTSSASCSRDDAWTNC